MKLAREFGIEVSDQPVEAVFQPCDGNSFLGEEYDVEGGGQVRNISIPGATSPCHGDYC